MSEIYNGTFVLGNTSATTISAGPGIKIDDSQPGVIKVSNDETVLYSGNLNMPDNNLVFNEIGTNFERIKILYSNNDGFTNSTEFIPTTGNGPSLFTITPLANGNTYIKSLTLTTTDTLTYSAVTSGVQYRFNHTSTGDKTTYNVSLNNTNMMKIKEVIGINRISGGN